MVGKMERDIEFEIWMENMLPRAIQTKDRVLLHLSWGQNAL